MIPVSTVIAFHLFFVAVSLGRISLPTPLVFATVSFGFTCCAPSVALLPSFEGEGLHHGGRDYYLLFALDLARTLTLLRRLPLALCQESSSILSSAQCCSFFTESLARLLVAIAVLYLPLPRLLFCPFSSGPWAVGSLDGLFLLFFSGVWCLGPFPIAVCNL